MWLATERRAGHTVAVRLISLISGLLLLAHCGPQLPCNGHVDLCDRPLNEVALPATHNAMASEADEFWEPNQQHGIARQLADGVRGMLLDVYPYEGALYLCHGYCDLGKTPFADALGEIRSFLEANPREILVFIFEDHAGENEIAAAITAAGLEGYVYTHDPGVEIPTLDELIDRGERLVITLEQGEPPPGWMHHVWSLFFDTGYGFKSLDDFSCELNRGAATNPFFLLNHWLADGFGLPDPEGAASSNAFAFLHARAMACWTMHGRIPNLIAVDFYATGDLFEVVDALNGVSAP